MQSNSAPFKTIFTILFIISLLISIAVKFKVITKKGMHVDSILVFAPTRELLAGKGLTNQCSTSPMVMIRDGKIPAYNFSYIGPIFFYAPFIKLFGDNTVMPFAIGQLLLMLIFAGLMLFYKISRTKLLLASSLLALTMMATFDESILDCPTQLQCFIFLIIFWRLRKQLLTRPLLAGVILGLSYQFRPETLGIMLGFFVYGLMAHHKAFVKNIFYTLSAFVFICLLAAGLRHLLGAASGSDHLLWVLGSDILTERNNMINLLEVHRLADLMNIDGLKSLSFKVLKQLLDFLQLQHPLMRRREMLLACIVLLLSTLYWMKQRTEERRDTMFTIITFIVIFILSALGWNDRRYFDIIGVLILLFVIDNFDFYQRNFDFASNKAVNLLLIYLLIIININNYDMQRKANSIQQERNYRKAGKALTKAIAANAKVISNKCEIWTWYGGGTQCVHSSSTDVNEKVLSIYKPEAGIFFPPLPSTRFNLAGLLPDLSLTKQGLNIVLFR